MNKVLALVMCALLFATVRTGPAGREEARVLVIETTDIHGYLIDTSSGREDRFTYRLAAIASAIERLRASGEYDDVLLLDGGDLYQGTPVSALTGGASVRAALDVMDYDAVCLGNHEFDWGVDTYAADADGTVAPYELGGLIGDSAVPVLACNLYDAATGERVPFTRDYTVVEKAGRRIAVIGYIPDYSRSVLSRMIEPYVIREDPDALEALAERVRERAGADAVVVLAHTDPIPVAGALDPDVVDLVAGGHDHRARAEYADNGIACIQGNCNAQGFAAAVLVFRGDGTVSAEEISYTDIMADADALRDLPGNADRLDGRVMDVARMAWGAVSEEMNQVLGWIDTPVLREGGMTTVAGNWVTDLMLRATRTYGAVAAFYNGGGIRTSLRIPEGETVRNVTVGDVYTITPFGNALLVYDLTGPELARQIEAGLRDGNYGDQVAGLTYTYACSGAPGAKRGDMEYTVLSVTMADGTPVDLADGDTLYRVCVSSYSATLPGSVFEGRQPVVPEADAPVDYESIIAMLREEAAQSGGYLYVDAEPRGVEAEQEMDPAA